MDLAPLTALSLFLAGLLAGIANAIAGGGTFFSFPIFIAAGLPPVVANASNAVAVWPGHALATFGYHRELKAFTGNLWLTGFVTGMGGAIGAYLLAIVGNDSFAKLVPCLLVVATALFASGPAINKKLSRSADAPMGFGGRLGVFLFSVYGGFFGAGLGIMLMAGLLVLGVHDPQQNNALKNFLATIVTSVGVIVLALSGLIAWPQTICAFVGATAGGLIGARVARYLPASLLRKTVIALGCLLSLNYFLKYY